MPNILYDPDRIKPIIELLEKQWIEHPQMRLGQLIINVADHVNDNYIFYAEDDYIKRRLKEFKF